MLKGRGKSEINAYVYLIPIIGVFLINVLYPMSFNVLLSFFKWDGFNRKIFKNFIGWQSYLELAHNQYFWIALRNTAYFEIGCCIFQVLFPLILSVIIYYGYFKLENVVKSIFYFPALISPVLVGLMWRYFFALDGPVNRILKDIGLDFLAIQWWSNIFWPIWLITFMNIWQWTGFGIVLFYAGLSSINEELIEAARIDGASFSQYIRKIVIPLLKPVVLLDILLVFISGFRVFDIVYVTTRGGPVHYSEVLTTLQYYYSFDTWGPNKMGVGAVISVVLLMIVLIFSLVRISILRSESIKAKV